MNLHPPGRHLIGLVLLPALVLGIGFVVLRAYLHSSSRGLPYTDSFSKGSSDEWKAFGGTWELSNGTMRNESDERGAKLLTGSQYWRDYSIEADVYLLGNSGDAGLIIRSSNEEEGVNSYSGYYAGIRTLDGALVLGRAEHGWMEVNRPIRTSADIRPFQWYHVKLLAYQCEIVTEVSTFSPVAHYSIGINDRDCLSSGRAGLRSYSAGGIWRNVVVRPALAQDLKEMLKSSDGKLGLSPRNGDQQGFDLLDSQQLPSEELTGTRSSRNTQSISSLRLESFVKPAKATVRGAVVLTVPRLYVQDSTGGLYVPHPDTPPLKVGDEVEISGDASPGDFSSTMQNAHVKVLWAGTPEPPVSVTASQASTGRYDATFIEVHGRLAAKERGPGNSLILDLDEGTQTFRAMMNPGRGDYLFSKLKLNSSLRLRGICVVDRALAGNLTPFVLLLRSSEDLEVLAGPPWWSAGHIISLIIATLLLALIFNSAYHRMAHWRLQGVLEERQRLAHEMHDTLAQCFAGIGFQLQAIRNSIPADNLPVLQQLDLASDLARHSHQEARRSIATLGPESLDSEDLLTALDLCARRMVEGCAVRIIMETNGDQRTIALRIRDSLYRVGQEAIANAVRHSNPSVLTIRLLFGENIVRLQVEDDGKGFVPGSHLTGFGIRGMRRRAESVSAKFEIRSAPGQGTKIQLSAPLPPRITLSNLSETLWRYAREHWFDLRSSKRANSHSYR